MGSRPCPALEEPAGAEEGAHLGLRQREPLLHALLALPRLAVRLALDEAEPRVARAVPAAAVQGGSAGKRRALARRSTQRSRGPPGPCQLRSQPTAVCRVGLREGWRERPVWSGLPTPSQARKKPRKARALPSHARSAGDARARTDAQRGGARLLPHTPRPVARRQHQRPAGAHRMRSAMAPGFLSRRPWYSSSESLSK